MYLINATQPGAVATRADLVLPLYLDFGDIFNTLCAHMDVDPTTAMLGYKFDKEHVCDAPCRLTTSEDWQSALEVLVPKMQRTWAATPKLNIYYLVCISYCSEAATY
jgi:hypothetical protein